MIAKNPKQKLIERRKIAQNLLRKVEQSTGHTFSNLVFSELEFAIVNAMIDAAYERGREVIAEAFTHA